MLNPSCVVDEVEMHHPLPILLLTLRCSYGTTWRKGRWYMRVEVEGSFADKILPIVRLEVLDVLNS